VAGNVVSPHALGSILYAISNLGSRLVMVLGHTKCAPCIIIIIDHCLHHCLQGLALNACCQHACMLRCIQRTQISMLIFFNNL
jgi:carbonic anhydrase